MLCAAQSSVIVRTPLFCTATRNMPKKKKGKGKSKATTPFDQDAFDRTMSVLPPPTPGTGKRIGRSIWRPEGYLVCRVNELVTVRFANDPDGLVEHLRTLPKEEGGLNAVNVRVPSFQPALPPIGQ